MFFRGLIILSLLFSMVTICPEPTFAQNSADEIAKTSTGGPRKQLATIIFAGLAGAILGLSTLSFYGRPQDKLSNIAVGFAIGIIGGTVYTTYEAATKPYSMRQDYGLLTTPVDSQNFMFETSIAKAPKLQMSWSF